MKTEKNYFLIFLITIVCIIGCQKSNYPGAEVSRYIGIYDLRTLYKDVPLILDEDLMGGASSISAVVISDHRAGNMPEGYLIVQDIRRLSLLRGICIQIGTEASNYLPGDSVIVDIVGATLDRVDGILQLQNVNSSKITKVQSGLPINVKVATTAQIVAKPNEYESTLQVIVKGSFNPIPSAGETLSGDLTINDGFGNLTLSTDASAEFADNTLYNMANYYGILFNKLSGSSLTPYIKVRSSADIVELNSVYDVPKIIITGFVSDANGTDANNEYIQLMATQDINFATTPFSLVTTNNAGTSTPSGYPTKGWATGDLRTYKFNLTTGTAEKGTYFYVGGRSKLINGASSTSIADANWIVSYGYNTLNGFDFGTKTTNLLANSGNSSGIALFEGTTVTSASIPIDVIFVATGGSLYNNGVGYPIANTDYYDMIDPIKLTSQPFYMNGTNNKCLLYGTSDLGFFNILGGEYNLSLKRWTKARVQELHLMTKQSQRTEIEGANATKLVD
ncbi:DUF5689 domain-containing protein [Sphingobacterium hungaricum]